MYYIGIGKAAHGFRVSVVMDSESRVILGYGVGTYHNVKKIEDAAINAANVFLEKYKLEKISEIGKNRLISSFFRSLTVECLDFRNYKTKEEFAAVIDDYIDYYNKERIHSTLKYKTPFEVWLKNLKQ